jgi:regulatory protein YycH of two-component signal transduction system YycFG
MTYSRLRSILLFLLVLISLVQSFAIWHGDWLNHSEAGLSDLPTPSPVTSTSPQIQDAEAPYQIVLQTGKQAKYSVQLPGTSDYEDWMQQLASLSINGLKPVLQSNTATGFRAVRIEFGNSLDRTSLQQIVPSLANAAFPERTQTITLFQTGDSQPVMIDLSAPGEPDDYLGRTDINPSDFDGFITAAVTDDPWLLWNADAQSFLPLKSQSLKRYTWKSHQPSLMPLVHSFFVNPNALTRIQEQNGEILWTDGSRAVQWSKANGRLVFEDPNAASTGNAGTTNQLNTALSFIQNHGGGPSHLMPYGQNAQNSNLGATTYRLRPIVDGLPVLENSPVYQVTLDEGHVIEFQRPTMDQAVGTVHTKVNTMSGSKLLDVLQKQLKLPDANQWTLVYGYAVMANGGGHDELEPAVELTSPSGHDVEIDAVGGQVIKGGGAS